MHQTVIMTAMIIMMMVSRTINNGVCHSTSHGGQEQFKHDEKFGVNRDNNINC